jgi:hypothetical protein
LVKHTKTGKNRPSDSKLYQMAIKFAKCPQNILNGHKICQHFPFQDPPKIGIFGMKIDHLATLHNASKSSVTGLGDFSLS